MAKEKDLAKIRAKRVRKKKVSKFVLWTIYFSLLGGYVIKSFAGEIVDEMNYAKLRQSVVSESTVEEPVIPEEVVIESIPEEITDFTEEEEEIIIEPEVEEEEVIEEVEQISSELLDNGYNFQSIDFSSLIEANSETCGWIISDDTPINYPIVNATYDDGNEYYLHHDMYGNKSTAGTLYVDARSNSLADTENGLSDITLIYGHHLKGNKMFASICSYDNQSYYDEHPFAVIYTPDGYAYKLDFFAGMKYSGETDAYIYQSSLNEEDFYDYVEYLRTYSTFTSDVELEYGDRIVGLVTCEYSQGTNSRYILFAVAHKQYTNEIQKGNDANQLVLH